MPNRFTNQAANADVMKDDGQIEMPNEIGADGTPRDRSDHTPETRGAEAKADEAKAGQPKEGEAKPGKDINAAGFVKDKDAAKP
jgi:hypothetical protein